VGSCQQGSLDPRHRSDSGTVQDVRISLQTRAANHLDYVVAIFLAFSDERRICRWRMAERQGTAKSWQSEVLQA
jgi:hypothetical protein